MQILSSPVLCLLNKKIGEFSSIFYDIHYDIHYNIHYDIYKYIYNINLLIVINF